MSHSLDTNVILRWLLFDVPKQAEQVDALLKSSKTKLHVADVAVVEAAWALERVYEFSRSDVAAFITQVIDCKSIHSNKVLFAKVLPHYVLNPKISFADATLACYAEIGGQKLLTFDKALAKALPNNAQLLS